MKKQLLLIIFITTGLLCSKHIQGQTTEQQPKENVVAGDRGTPAGIVGGTEPRTLIIATVSDRALVNRPDPKTFKSKDAGMVVMQITVNRDGLIISHRVISATSNIIRDLAIKNIDSFQFNKAITAPPEQFGRVTFKFVADRI